MDRFFISATQDGHFALQYRMTDHSYLTTIAVTEESGTSYGSVLMDLLVNLLNEG